MTAKADIPPSSPSSGKIPATCCIRTLNEAARIGVVIDAARRLVDDVVVMDSGSTDDTVKIAEAHGARAFHQPWLGSGRQKRAGEDKALHHWILDLDADEVLSDAAIAEIRGLFATGQPPLNIYELTIITAPPIGEPWYGFQQAIRKRLYDKRVVRAPDHKAWDQFDIPPGEGVGRVKGAVLHHSFRDFAQFSEKANRASTSRARDSRLKSRAMVVTRVLIGPPLYFIKHYIQRGMWRAGLYGFIISALAAHGRWLRDIKMYEIYRTRDQQKKG